MANGNGLASVNHVVVLMLENRSFDHMLGFLYPGNVSPSGQPFDGLTGTESNPATSSGQPVTVFRIEPTTPSAYYMPGADPGEAYMATNDQLYGSNNGPASYRAPAGGTPLDHTSVLKTVEQRWNLPTLTARDAATPGFGDVLTLTTPRTDDVLAGVTVPVASGPAPAAGTASHLESIQSELIARRLSAGQSPETRPASAPGVP
jgi:phospholipase C